VVLGNEVKSTVLILMMATMLSGPAAAASIATTYDMDRMLSEPHPLANEYGTRWQQPPSPLQPAAAPGTQQERLTLPVTPTSTAAAPSTMPVPGQAPEPPLTTFAPPPPPPASSTAPPAPAPIPQPAPAKPPVETTAPPPLVMSPQLSIDLSGIDLTPEPQAPGQVEPAEPAEPQAVLPPPMEKEMAQPGPRPPLPPQ
jgi:hypothetical protein